MLLFNILYFTWLLYFQFSRFSTIDWTS